MKLLRQLLLILFSVMAIISCRQTTKNENIIESNNDPKTIEESKPQMDSLIISDDEFTSEPFEFTDKPIHFLLTNKEFSIEDSVEYYEGDLKTEDFKNGAYYKLSNSTDSFVIYKRLDKFELLIDAEIKSNDLTTRHGIEIGLTKSEFIEKFNHPDISVIPRILIIGDLDYSYFSFEFNGERLTTIKYSGYID